MLELVLISKSRSFEQFIKFFLELSNLFSKLENRNVLWKTLGQDRKVRQI